VPDARHHAVLVQVADEGQGRLAPFGCDEHPPDGAAGYLLQAIEIADIRLAQVLQALGAGVGGLFYEHALDVESEQRGPAGRFADRASGVLHEDRR